MVCNKTIHLRLLKCPSTITIKTNMAITDANIANTFVDTLEDAFAAKYGMRVRDVQ
jgi:hypothetical protein